MITLQENEGSIVDAQLFEPIHQIHKQLQYGSGFVLVVLTCVWENVPSISSVSEGDIGRMRGDQM